MTSHNDKKEPKIEINPLLLRSPPHQQSPPAGMKLNENGSLELVCKLDGNARIVAKTLELCTLRNIDVRLSSSSREYSSYTPDVAVDDTPTSDDKFDECDVEFVKHFVLISGRSGSGKSFLAAELARMFQDKNDVRVIRCSFAESLKSEYAKHVCPEDPDNFLQIMQERPSIKEMHRKGIIAYAEHLQKEHGRSYFAEQLYRKVNAGFASIAEQIVNSPSFNEKIAHVVIIVDDLRHPYELAFLDDCFPDARLYTVRLCNPTKHIGIPTTNEEISPIHSTETALDSLDTFIDEFLQTWKRSLFIGTFVVRPDNKSTCENVMFCISVTVFALVCHSMSNPGFLYCLSKKDSE